MYRKVIYPSVLVYSSQFIKLYHVPDVELLQQHRIIYPTVNKINLGETVDKEVRFKYPESAILVQAIKVVGKDNITSEIIEKIRNKIDSKLYAKIIKDTKTISDWTYSVIKQICREASLTG